MIRFIDLFSGIGGFRLGLERCNDEEEKEKYECVWSCDNNRYANNIYYKRFKPKRGSHYTGNVRRVNPEKIQDHEVLCAGFPCQSFSNAGKRMGFEDTKGTLFFEIARIAKIKRPKILLLENVKGLLSNQRGDTFTRILQTLDELGYWITWQCIDSQYFRVPQHRERVFIIGHLRGKSGREVFPITEGDIISKKATRQRLKKVGNIAKSGHDSIWGRVYDPKGLASTINAKAGGLGAKTGLYAIELAYTKANMRQGRLSKVSHALDGGHSKGVILGNIYPSEGEAGKIHDPNSIFSTVKQGKRGGKAGVPPILDGARIRRLTPVECERLQAFPDGWTEGISETRRYDVIGNAVTVNVIEYLGRRIRERCFNDS